MARDLELAADVVRTVMDEMLKTTSLGDAFIEVNSFAAALDRAVVEVADLLDPDESMIDDAEEA